MNGLVPMIREKITRPLFRSTLEDLRADLDELQRLNVTAEYRDKQLHRVPDWPVVERELFILEQCRGRRVLNLGSASGLLHDAIRRVALSVVGVDKEPGPQTDIWLDLDDYLAVQSVSWPPCDVIVLGEVVEHLTSPGIILKRLQGHPSVKMLTVPNAYAAAGYQWMSRGYENINADHTMWCSWKTITVLLEKCGYTVQAGYWYGGVPKWAEGMIILAH